MSIQIQFRRGTTAEHSTFTGAVGEITVDTTKDTAVVHDNSQVGGFALLREDGSNSALSDGSASVPSIKFSSSTTTGIYSPGTNQFAIATNGVGRITIDASGNIVAGGTLTVGSFIPTSSTIPSNGLYSPGTNQVALSTNGTQRINIEADGDINIDSGGVFYDATNNRLGVGTTSPAELLSLSKTVNTSEDLLSLSGTSFGDGETIYQTFKRGSVHLAKIGAEAASAGQAGHLVFETALSGSASEAARIDSSGRLGIGTSSPIGLLQVKYATNVNTSFRNSSAAGLTAGTLVEAVNDGFSAFTPYYIRASEYGFGTDSGGTYVPRFTIDSSGRVGIGTTSPEGPLHVLSNPAGTVTAHVNGNLGIFEDGVSNGISILTPDVSTGAIFFGSPTSNRFAEVTASYTSGLMSVGTRKTGGELRFISSNATEAARIDSSGRLLVGTSSATTGFGGVVPKVQIESTSVDGARFSIVRNAASIGSASIFLCKTRSTTNNGFDIVSDGDSLGSISFYGADGTDFVQAASISAGVDGTPGADDMPGRLMFSTTADGASSPTERMRIGQNGSVFIGNTGTLFGNTGTEINASGTANFSRASSYPLLLNRQTTDGTIVEIRRSWTTVGTISVTTTATAYNTSSDYRLKENVTPVTDGITRLQQLKPSRFNFIADPDKTVDGFLAHEVQTIVPEAITGEKDAVDDEGNPQYQGIDQSKLVPLLTAALQEAIGEIESLKARVAALEAP